VLDDFAAKFGSEKDSKYAKTADCEKGQYDGDRKCIVAMLPDQWGESILTWWEPLYPVGKDKVFIP
jgi:hypothetical protein